MPRSRSLGVPLALGLLLAALPAQASATPPGTNGRITFMRMDGQGFWQTWTANPDLTSVVKLTAGGANSGWSVWSPDGARIAFDSDRADPDLGDGDVVNDVFTMRRDGTDVRKLTDSVGFSGDPHYSADGRWIVYDANRGSEPYGIFVIRPDGTGMRRLTTAPIGSLDSAPRFSPDGTKIVFTRYRDGHVNHYGRVTGDTSALFVVGVDGSGMRRVTGWGARVGDADWSPDGTKLVYEQVGEYRGPTDIFIVPSTGGDVKRLTDGEGIRGSKQSFRFEGFHDPVFSPDGRLVLFGHGLLRDDGSFFIGLSTIRPDGTGIRWVAEEVFDEHQPDWGTAPRS